MINCFKTLSRGALASFMVCAVFFMVSVYFVVIQAILMANQNYEDNRKFYYIFTTFIDTAAAVMSFIAMLYFLIENDTEVEDGPEVCVFTIFVVLYLVRIVLPAVDAMMHIGNGATTIYSIVAISNIVLFAVFALCFLFMVVVGSVALIMLIKRRIAERAGRVDEMV